MAVARVTSAQPSYPYAVLVDVETDLGKGLNSFSIVGLPDKAVDEAKDRVSSGIKNSGYPSPKSTNVKTVVSLAPADFKKEGTHYDLPIAVSYLIANGVIPPISTSIMLIGELALDGGVRGVRGVLACAIAAKKAGCEAIVVPLANAEEASLVDGVSVYPITTLKELILHLRNEVLLSRHNSSHTPKDISPPRIDFFDIRGQESAKRALEIAAAGRHNIVLYGPPGTGKSMLAQAFCGILPPLTHEEALEATIVHSLAGVLHTTYISEPPMRAPHHTSSHIALVGGGSTPRPGEITLAHRGVLFLDEFPEFERRTIDALREPLEGGEITIARARGAVKYPANFILVAAMNPTRGHDGVQNNAEKDRLQKKISGPVVDRIDIWIEVGLITHSTLSSIPNGERSIAIQNRVADARKLQYQRFNINGKTNSEMSVRDLDTFITMNADAKEVLNQSAQRLQLSPRSYHRVVKLSRTIADLSKSENVESAHVLEALHYRPKDLFI